MKLFEEAMRRGASAAQSNREALERLFAAAQREEKEPRADSGDASEPAGPDPEHISERFERDARRYPRPLDNDWRDGR